MLFLIIVINLSLPIRNNIGYTSRSKTTVATIRDHRKGSPVQRTAKPWAVGRLSKAWKTISHRYAKCLSNFLVDDDGDDDGDAGLAREPVGEKGFLPISTQGSKGTQADKHSICLSFSSRCRGRDDKREKETRGGKSRWHAKCVSHLDASLVLSGSG